MYVLVALPVLLLAVNSVHGGCADDWQQCGGQGWNGATCCNSGYTCEAKNQWYSQCVAQDNPPNPSGGGVAAVTTRYWDCCKPSCGWMGKGPAKPVNNCARDGNTIIGNNAQSGCNGGPSYVCNNQVPWAVNDKLAYGFAAFNGFPGVSPCCRCYKLDFTSGPVVGKSMIVQVTNSGGDLGQAHFDLQIPGGGVGIFNGCSSQWGAPGDGWGARYGGVSNIGQCYQLPAPLQEGCKFRFTWFQGADNPRANVNEVSCPPELIQRTGCYA